MENDIPSHSKRTRPTHSNLRKKICHLHPHLHSNTRCRDSYRGNNPRGKTPTVTFNCTVYYCTKSRRIVGHLAFSTFLEKSIKVFKKKREQNSDDTSPRLDHKALQSQFKIKPRNPCQNVFCHLRVDLARDITRDPQSH